MASWLLWGLRGENGGRGVGGWPSMQFDHGDENCQVARLEGQKNTLGSGETLCEDF